MNADQKMIVAPGPAPVDNHAMIGPETRTLTPGDIVRLRQPVDEAEERARFEVVELRGERLLIRLQCDLPIPPTEAVALTDVELCCG